VHCCTKGCEAIIFFKFSHTPEAVSTPRIKYTVPPNISKIKVLEFIQKLNASGEVIISILILKNKIDKRMTRYQMLRLNLHFYRYYYISVLFELLK